MTKTTVAKGFQDKKTVNYSYLHFMKIFLIGYMASGKSTLGQMMAEELHLPFIDLDQEIEETEGKSISEIFAQENGESLFRELEKDELNDIIKHREKFVMATGGGTPCYHDGILQMNLSGTTIFLDVSVNELIHRIYTSENRRPLLAEKTEAQTTEFIEKTLAERRPIYEQAGFLLRGDNLRLADLMSLSFKR